MMINHNRERKMTKVAIWCRHETDNLIGIGTDIPWHIPSDSKFFADVINGQDVVFGRKTYESVSPKFWKIVPYGY